MCAVIFTGAAGNIHAQDVKTGRTGGMMTKQTYFSTTTGVNRSCHVYTPAGYTETKKYGVLYVLHGIGGTEDEWPGNGAPHRIMDELYAGGEAEPMILVFPNGRAMSPDSVPQNPFSVQ